MAKEKLRVTLCETIYGRVCQVCGDKTKCVCIRLRNPKRQRQICQVCLVGCLDGLDQGKPYILYPKELTDKILAGEAGQEEIQELLNKEPENDEHRGVLPDVLDSPESVLPKPPQEDD